MHIAQMIDSLNWGGAQKLQVTFASAVHPGKVDLTVICLRHDYNSPIPGELGALGARVVTFPSRRLLSPWRIARITRFLREEHFDVLQTHLTYANILGGVVGRLAGVPVVSTLHSVGYDKRYSHPIKQLLETWALRYGAQQVVAVGHSVAEAHQARTGNRSITVIPNAVVVPSGLSSTRRTEIRTRLMGDPARSLLISVGRLSPPKGYFDLLDAFGDLHKTHSGAVLAIVGAGALYTDLTLRVATLGLGDRVLLLGARNDVPDLLAASDIYVSASHWEGLPLAVLEAMAAGLPIVATKVGDVPRVVVNGTGVLVAPHEPVAMATAIRLLLDDRPRMRALGTAARDHVVYNYSPTAWVEQLLALYRSVRTKTDVVLQPQGEIR